MLYVHFANPCTTICQARHQLGRDHGSGCVQFHSVEQFAPEQLESAVNVADLNSKQQTHEQRPGFAIETPDKMISALLSPSNHDIMIMYSRRQQSDLIGIELSVAIAQQHIRLARCANAGNYGRAISPI